MTRWCLVLGLLASCSFSIDGPDPARPRLRKPTCETEKNLVVVDALLATTAGIATIGFAADKSAVALVPAVFGAVFVGAAVHGSHAVDACRADNEAYLAAVREKPEPLVEPQKPAVAVSPIPIVPVVAAPPITPMARDRWADFWKVVQ